MRKDFSIPETHADLAILCANTGTNTSDLRGTSCVDSTSSYEGNYIKVLYLSYWSADDIATLKEDIAKTNESTTEYQFEFDGVQDYEVEYDNDRSWPASFSIKSHKKNL
jgi:hypothetical protein